MPSKTLFNREKLNESMIDMVYKIERNINTHLRDIIENLIDEKEGSGIFSTILKMDNTLVEIITLLEKKEGADAQIKSDLFKLHRSIFFQWKNIIFDQKKNKEFVTQLIKGIILSNQDLLTKEMEEKEIDDHLEVKFKSLIESIRKVIQDLWLFEVDTHSEKPNKRLTLTIKRVKVELDEVEYQFEKEYMTVRNMMKIESNLKSEGQKLLVYLKKNFGSHLSDQEVKKAVNKLPPDKVKQIFLTMGIIVNHIEKLDKSQNTSLANRKLDFDSF